MGISGSLLLAGMSAGLAEVRTFSIDQLKRVSGTLPRTPAGAGRLPAAVPYQQIEMPPLPAPVKHEVKTVPVEQPGEPPVAAAMVAAGVSASEPVTPTKVVPVINGDKCRAALRLTAELAVNAYQDRQDKGYMHLVAAATVADDVVRAGHIPNLRALEVANGELPWFGPFRSELNQAMNVVKLTCTPVGGRPVVTPGQRFEVEVPN